MTRMSLGCSLALTAVWAQAASLSSVEVALVDDTGAMGLELTWPTVTGERYEIQASGSLADGLVWETIETDSLIGDGNQLSLVLPLDPLSAGSFYQVVSMAQGPLPEIIQDGLVRPEDPYVALGSSQAFTAVFPDGSPALWDLLGLESLDMGQLTAAGVYTAPATLPELPFAGIQAQSSTEPDRLNRTTAILLPADEIRISREQAIAILQHSIIDPHPRKDLLLALGLHEPIGREDELRVSDPDRRPGQSEPAGSDPCWFFLVDEDPTANWMHPVRYVTIDCRSGDLLMNERAFWYPELNGQPFWNRVRDRVSVRDRVFVGDGVAPELEPAPLEFVEVELGEIDLFSNRRSRAGIVRLEDDFIPIPRMFPRVPNACNCPGTPQRHALIGVMSPEEDVLLASGNAWETLFRQNAFQTELVLDGEVSKVRQRLDKWRTTVRPCDVVVVMLLGHGLAGSVSGISSSELVKAFRLIPTGAKYFVLEACDAGHVFEIFKKNKPTPRVEILTASNRVDPEATIQFTGVSPLNVVGDSKSAFSGALFACFSRFDTLSEVHRCLTSVSDIGPAAIRLKLADPQLERVGSDDSDQDGVPDDVEMTMGLNPSVADTDGDGVCDGIEVGQTANLELRFGQTRGDRYIRGKRKPVISGSAAPPRVLNNETYRLQLSVTGGVPFTRGPVGFGNPFGFGAMNGWFLEQGALPEGIRLERDTGMIMGTPRSFGSFRFTVKYVDAIGVAATKAFEVRAVNIIGTTGRVRVSAAGDGNQRDDHVTLREAVLLCTGKLSQDDLKQDPDFNDNKVEGERRWITGELGAPFHNTIVFEEPMTIRLTEGPLVFDTHASSLVMGEKRIRIESSSGPVLDFQGDRNAMQDICFIKVASGPAIRISGEGNFIGEPFSLWQHPSIVIEGGGLGIGVEVTGKRNTVASFSVEGFDVGFLLRGEAAYNTIDSMRCGKNRVGMELSGNVTHNRIFDCRMGLAFAETEDHLPSARGNTDHGLVLRDGASFNVIEACGMAANGGNGVLVDGEMTDSNTFIDLEIGSQQSFRSVAGTIAPNGGHGIAFVNGSSRNLMRACQISDNLGDGLRLSGAGTDGNLIGAGAEQPVSINKPSDSGDAIVIRDGASENELAIEVLRSGREGVVIIGAETRDNRITCRKYSTVLSDFVVPSEIKNCAGVGVFIGGGATNTQIEEWTRIENCESGIVIDGSGTQNNCVEKVVVRQAKTNAIRLSNRAQSNLLGPDLILEASGESGVLITGAGTDFNFVRDSFKLSEMPHGRYAIEITRGAKYNTIRGVSVFNHRMGGMALTGSGTQFNRVLSNDVTGQFATEAAEDAPGILLADGASGNLVLDNQIGAGKGDGIRMSGTTTMGNTINRNSIHSFAGNGILIDDASGNLVGSPTGDGNRIDNNQLAGIRIQGDSASGNRILGNNIGNTSFREGNGGHGVEIVGGLGNRVGGVRPIRRDVTEPLRREVPDPEERGAGNVIVGNGGDGVRISGGKDHQVLGNLIGAKQVGFFVGDFGNGGHGIHVLENAASVCIGNCVSLAVRAIGFGNVIQHNHGAGVRIAGVTTSRVSVRENNLFLNDGGRLLLEEGGNGGIEFPEVSIDSDSRAIVGESTRRGYIEIYSDAPGHEGTYHLTAVVGRGRFEIDRFAPRARSKNALILQEEVALPVGRIYLNFTEFRSGNSTPFTVLD